MGRRSYDQYCPFARSLDVLGERWTLLVIRELLLGPRRFSDLLEGLPGVGPNVLTARLKLLQEEGIIQRIKLPPPAGSTVYEFTELGRELEPALLALGRWGLHFMGERRDVDSLRFAWVINGMRLTFDPEKARGVDDTYEFRVGGEVVWVRVLDGRLTFGQGAAHDPDAIITCDLEAFQAIGLGELDPAEALADGRSTVQGDLEAAMRAAEILTLPAGYTAAAGAAASS